MASSSLDDVLVSSLTSWDELSMDFFSVFGRPGTPGKVPHCWKFLFVCGKWLTPWINGVSKP